ncbi:hypothetical protein ACVR05_02915 [Streptococcus caprae]
MVTKSGILNKAGKALGTVGNVIGLFDAVKMVENVTDKAAPLIDKAIDRHYDGIGEQILVQSMIHLSLTTGQEHLERQGFVVAPVLVKPDKKYASLNAQEIVDQVPKSGKYKPGSLIKVYYVDQATLEASQELAEQAKQKAQNNVKAMTDTLAHARDFVLKKKTTEGTLTSKD